MRPVSKRPFDWDIGELKHGRQRRRIQEQQLMYDGRAKYADPLERVSISFRANGMLLAEICVLPKVKGTCWILANFLLDIYR